MKGNKPIRAAIYARVSTTEQNPELQLEELRKYVQQRGFILHKEYIDYISGNFDKRRKKRKPENTAYQELMADASKRLIDCVIVWKYDRFARSLRVLIEDLEQFNKLGIDFISYTQNIDTTTPMGRLFYNVIGSFSEFEREMIVERVRAGLANAKAKGVRLGRPEKDPSAPQRITALREEGWSLRKIAEREKLSPAGVLKILRRKDASSLQSEVETKMETLPATPNLVSNICAVTSEIWQFKIYLLIVKPKIWRRVLVPNNITLAKLSDVIQKLFGWTDPCPHMFVPRDARGGYELKCNENTFRLCDFGLKPGDGMLYEYGYDWTHEVSFEKTVCFDQKLRYPVCIGGAMAVPPDDQCDGALQYMERKKKRSKKSVVNTFFNGLPYISNYSPDHSNFDPHRFDIIEINQRLGVATPEKYKRSKLIAAKKNQEAAAVSIPEQYQLRICICDVTPLIWRRVLISSATTLDQLSDIIQVLFDWGGYHLHKFMLPSPFSRGMEIAEGSADNTALSAMGLQPGDSVLYEYDFGDSWMHEIVWEKISPLSKSRSYPVCTAGRNAGPPEDCGGPEAYMNARNYLSRRKGKPGRAPRGRVSWSEKEFYKENYRSFDPDKFDKDEVTRQLANLAKANKKDDSDTRRAN